MNTPQAFERQEKRHMNRLQAAWKTQRRAKHERRGWARQWKQRKLDHLVRRSALAFCRWTAKCGLSRRQAAERLHLAPRTLAEWEKAWQENRRDPAPRGRPLHRADRDSHNAVIGLMRMLPHAGVPILEALFPNLARGELADLRHRFRRVYRRKNRLLVHALHWSRPGAVWAIDYAQPPLPIEGRYRYLLAVRDLASGQQLAWLPVVDPDARAACDLLKALFREHGAPLVLKADNGSPFHSAETQKLLQQENVVPLFSPVRMPRYNGACEAGIGSMKTRTHHEAARHDHPGEWTCDDCEAARLQANELARPWGASQPTPDLAWAERAIITPQERAAFPTAVQDEEIEARSEQGYEPNAALGHNAQATIHRVAIRRALVAIGILRFRRRRITLPIKGKKVARIW
jgi:transposase InsO family protein